MTETTTAAISRTRKTARRPHRRGPQLVHRTPVARRTMIFGAKMVNAFAVATSATTLATAATTRTSRTASRILAAPIASFDATTESASRQVGAVTTTTTAEIIQMNETARLLLYIGGRPASTVSFGATTESA